MNIEDAAGTFLILVPIAFNAFFSLLARLFESAACARATRPGGVPD